MTFKLRSQVAVFAGFEGVPSVEHTVLVREKTLRSGNIIRTKGYVATDVEGKGPWDSANVIIRIIDDEKLGVKWKRTWLSRQPFLDTGGYFDEKETIIEGRDQFKLREFGGSYASISEYELSETFTIIDKIRIPHLVNSKLNELDGFKDVRRSTKLVYEPTLPPHAKR